jgi:hypothetical protein
MAEIARGLIRMNEKVKGTNENNGNYGRGVFKWHEKVCGKAQLATNRSLCQRKTEFGPEKRLANLWSRQRITKIAKKVHAGRGPETIWEIPDKTWDAEFNNRDTNSFEKERVVAYHVGPGSIMPVTGDNPYIQALEEMADSLVCTSYKRKYENTMQFLKYFNTSTS